MFIKQRLVSVFLCYNYRVSIMKKMKCVILIMIVLTIAIGCSSRNEDTNIKTIESTSSNEVLKKMKLTINKKEYVMNLEDNETAKKFAELSLQEVTMKELNGNEKYVYLSNTLPTNPVYPKKINTGDVMLYGNDCLVIFYKSFNTSYSYTKIGHIENLPDLGKNDITISFNK